MRIFTLHLQSSIWADDMNAPITPEEIKADMEVLTKATDGHWELGGPYPTVTVIHMVDGGCGYPEPEPPIYAPVAYLYDCHRDYETPPPEQAVNDAKAIALAHNRMPAYAREVQRLQAENQSLQTRLGVLVDAINDAAPGALT
jgi:hypothetical protein